MLNAIARGPKITALALLLVSACGGGRDGQNLPDAPLQTAKAGESGVVTLRSLTSSLSAECQPNDIGVVSCKCLDKVRFTTGSDDLVRQSEIDIIMDLAEQSVECRADS
jgi:hypothetical protein